MRDFTQIDWEDLKHFLALARGGSLSEAARALGVDHTTVARRLAALEKALDLRLVDRLPRSVTLTPQAEPIADLAERMAETAFAICRVADGARTTLAGPVRVSAPPAFATLVVAPRLSTLTGTYPDITVTLIGDVAEADLDHRQADISLRLSRPKSPDLIARKIGDLPFHFYAATDYDRPEEDWRFIGYDEESRHIPQHGWLEEHRRRRDVVLRTNDSASQASAAGAGIGVALLPAFLGEADPRLKQMPSAEALPSREIWILVHDDLRRAPRIRAVMDFLIETVRGAIGADRQPTG